MSASCQLTCRGRVCLPEYIHAGAYGRATPTPTLAHCGYSIKDILLCRFSYLRGLQQLTEMAYESCQSGVKRELDGVIAHLVGWKLDANTSCTVFRSRTIGL